MLNPADFIGCGQIIKTHGIKGEVKLGFVSNFIPEYQEGDWLFVEFHKKPVPFLIEAIEYSGDGLPAVKLADIDAPEEARKLLNRTILYPKADIPEDRQGALLVYQLDQFALYDSNHQYRGIIRDVIEQVHQFLLEVEKPDQTSSFLIPFQPSLVKSINREGKSVTMEVPEGLEEL